MELFDCAGLQARITPQQCRANRARPVSTSLQRLPTRPPACRHCTQWKTVDPPSEVNDPAEALLAETLATLWPDIEEGRLGIKWILTGYNRRAQSPLRRRHTAHMADWLLGLGFRLLDANRFKGVSGLRCLLVDDQVETFVRERGCAPLRDGRDVEAVERMLDVVGLGQGAAEPDRDGEAGVLDVTVPQPGVAADAGGALSLAREPAPCVRCRFFRPMPVFDGGIAGIRLCWVREQRWDFGCYSPAPTRRGGSNRP